MNMAGPTPGNVRSIRRSAMSLGRKVIVRGQLVEVDGFGGRTYPDDPPNRFGRGRRCSPALACGWYHRDGRRRECRATTCSVSSSMRTTSPVRPSISSRLTHGASEVGCGRMSDTRPSSCVSPLSRYSTRYKRRCRLGCVSLAIRSSPRSSPFIPAPKSCPDRTDRGAPSH
jgi:hypothetical protein